MIHQLRIQSALEPLRVHRAAHAPVHRMQEVERCLRAPNTSFALAIMTTCNLREEVEVRRSLRRSEGASRIRSSSGLD